jgi:KR domain
VQICRRFGAKFFCTALAVADAADLAALVDVDMESIAVILPGDDVKLIAQQWLTANRRAGFDVIFNAQHSFPCTAVIDLLKPMGHYIHIQRIPSDKVDIPSGAFTTNVIDVSKLLKHQPSKVASCLSALLVSHALAPFKVPLHAVLFSNFATAAASLTSSTMSLVAIPDMLESGRIDPTGQLFDPRKTYILLGGSSELGVRIARWMVTRGARHLVLTSRRGPAALTKIDLMYLHYLRLQNISVEVLSSDARDRRDTITTINRANEIAPLDGIFLMTVVLHDATISRLSQESFDDVYLSKVHTLYTLLSCVNTTDLRFLLLFSTIGSVFGNAGQAAYCASQS